MHLYLHIPFCDSKCLYCKFASIWQIDYKKVDKYIDKLINDINNTGSKSVLLSSVYFWWGTPGILQEKHLRKIFEAINTNYKINKNTEVTFETTPKRVTQENILIWQKYWINRISMWIETLNPLTLKTINRWTKDEIYSALELLEKSNFENISIDFIVWLPYVKKQEIAENIKELVWKYKKIKHISFYLLEAGIYPKNWKNFSLKEEDFLWEYIFTKNILENLWFQRYEISNFAKAWFECVHNKSYWEHKNYLGLWLWAHSFMNNSRFAYKTDFEAFYNDELEYKEELSQDDILLEKIMFQIRTTWIENKYRKYLNSEKINEFIWEKLLILENDFLKVTDAWVLLLDYILSEIIL